MLTHQQISQTEATLTKDEGASTFRWLTSFDVEAYDSQGNYIDTYHITLNNGLYYSSIEEQVMLPIQ